MGLKSNFSPQRFRKAAYEAIENQMRQKVSTKFPDLKDFGVEFLPIESKIRFTGLTEDQIKEVLNS